MTPPSDARALVDLLAAGGGRPRITWYGGGGERVELSGAVLANWTAKTTNLLVEEYDVGPGSAVALDLPVHWRTLVWALATWRAGGCVTLGDATGADVVVADEPGHHPAGRLVAVALPALARRFDGALPAGAVDAAAAVMTYGDVVGWTPDLDPAAPALRTPGGSTTHADLVAWATGAATTPAGARTLLETGPGRTDDVLAFLRGALAALAADGSVVVVDTATAGELAADPDRRARLLDGERVTAG